MFAHGLRDEGACGDERFLVGEGHHLAGLERGERGPQAAEAHHGAHHHVGRSRHEFAQALHARVDLDVASLQGGSHLFVIGLVADDHVGRIEFEGLGDEGVGAVVGAQQAHFKAVAVPADDVERLRPDGAGGAQDGDSSLFHD